MKQVYQADDGKCFDTQEECESYEANAEAIQDLCRTLVKWELQQDWCTHSDNLHEMASLLHSTYTMYRIVPELTDWSER